MSKLEPEIPTPTRIRGRLFFERLGWENYKRLLLGLPALERDPREPIELVSAIQASEELVPRHSDLDRLNRGSK